MKHVSARPKPPTGMEMSVTLSMPAGQSEDESAQALLKFLEALGGEAFRSVGAVWFRIRCSGIPERYESIIANAIAGATAKSPHLRIVVDNTREQA